MALITTESYSMTAMW